MAIVLNQDQDEQDQGGQIQGAQSGLISGGGARPSGSGSPGSPSSSGSYTNLRKYLDANQEQSKKMAQGIVQGVEKNFGQAREGLQGTQQQFNQSVQQGGVGYQPDLVNQATSDPTQFVQNQQNVDQFAKMRQGDYSGLRNLVNAPGYQQVQQQYSQGAEKAGQVATPEGRVQRLKETFARPTYTGGEQQLDQYLVQVPEPARQVFGNLRQQIQGFEGELPAAQQAAQQQAAARAAETQAAGEQTRAALGIDPTGMYTGEGAIGQFQGEVGERLAALQTQREAEATAMPDRIKNLNFTPEELASMGLASGQRVYGAFNQPSGLVSDPTVDRARAVTPEEFARSQALSQLAGGEGSVLGYGSNQELAGTLAPVGINPEAAKQSIASAQDYYNQQWGGATPFGGLQDVNTRFSTEYAGEHRGKTPEQAAAFLAQNPYFAAGGVGTQMKDILENWKRDQGYYNVV